jgi:hypothetical protein
MKETPMAKAQTATANPADGKTAGNETENAKVGPAIIVTARGPRRRAGSRFGLSPVTIPVADLSDAQQKALAGDPELQIKMADTEE